MLQTEAAECGLACLAMVAGYHGHEIDLLTLRRRYPISLKGTTLAHLIGLAERLKLSGRALRLELEQLDKLKCPAILHWDLDHFVVLKAVRRNRILLHDPACGAVTLKFTEASKHFTGVALELTPTARFVRRKERERLPLRALWGRQGGLKGFLVQIFIFSIALEIFAILAPFFTQIVIDRVLVADDWSLLTVLGLGFGLLVIITAAITAFRAWVILYLSTNLNYQMLARLFHHLLHLPLDYFTKRHVGDIVSRFGSLRTIQDTLTTQLVESLVDGLMVIGTLAVMFVYSVELSGIAIAMVTAYGLIRWLLYRPLYDATYEKIIRQALQETNFLETVRGMQAVRLLGAEVLRHEEWQNLLSRTLNAEVGVGKVQIAATVVNRAALGLGHVAIIWLGAEAILRGTFTIGMLFAFVAFSIQFSTKTINLIESGIRIKMLILHSARVADIALTAPEAEGASTLLTGVAPLVKTDFLSG